MYEKDSCWWMLPYLMSCCNGRYYGCSKDKHRDSCDCGRDRHYDHKHHDRDYCCDRDYCFDKAMRYYKKCRCERDKHYERDWRCDCRCYCRPEKDDC